MVERLPAQRPPDVVLQHAPQVRGRAAPQVDGDGEEEEPVRAARFDRADDPRPDDGVRLAAARPLGHLTLAAFGDPDLAPVDARGVLDAFLPGDQHAWSLVKRLTAAYEAAGLKVPAHVATDAKMTAALMAALGPAAVPTWLAARAEGRVGPDVVIEAITLLPITAAEARVLVAAAECFDDLRLSQLVRMGLAGNRALRPEDQRAHLHALVSDAAAAPVPALAHRPASTVATLNAGVAHPAAAVRAAVATALVDGTCGFGGLALPLRLRAADVLCRDPDAAVRAAAAGLFFRGSPRTAADVTELLMGFQPERARVLLAQAFAAAPPDADLVPALTHPATLTLPAERGPGVGHGMHPSISLAAIRAITASRRLTPSEAVLQLQRVVTSGSPGQVNQAEQLKRDAIARLAASHPEVCALDGVEPFDVQMAHVLYLTKALETPPATLVAAVEAWVQTDAGYRAVQALPEHLRARLIANADRTITDGMRLPDALRAQLRLGIQGPAELLGPLTRPPHKRPQVDSPAELIDAFIVVASDPTMDAATLKVALCAALTLCTEVDSARALGLHPPGDIAFHLVNGAERVTQYQPGPKATAVLAPAVLDRLVALLGDPRLDERSVSDILDHVGSHGTAEAFGPFLDTALRLGMPAHVVRTFAFAQGAVAIGSATVAPLPLDALDVQQQAELLAPTRAFTALLDARRPQRAALEDTLAAADLKPVHDVFATAVAVDASTTVAALTDASAATPTGLAALLDVADALSPTVHLGRGAQERLKALLSGAATPPHAAARVALQLLRRTMPNDAPRAVSRDALRGTAQATDLAAAMLRARDDLDPRDAGRIRVAAERAAERAMAYVDERPMRARAWAALEALLDLPPFRRTWTSYTGHQPHLVDGIALFQGFSVFAGTPQQPVDPRVALADPANTPLVFFDHDTKRSWTFAHAAPPGANPMRPPEELMAQLTGRFPAVAVAPERVVPAGLTALVVHTTKKQPSRFVCEPQWRDDAGHDANAAQQLSVDLELLGALREGGTNLDALSLTVDRRGGGSYELVLEKTGDALALPLGRGNVTVRLAVRSADGDRVSIHPLVGVGIMAQTPRTSTVELQVDVDPAPAPGRPRALLRMNVHADQQLDINLGALARAARYVLEREREDADVRA